MGLNREWIPSGSNCPTCGQETEMSYKKEADGQEYETGERCTKCRWVVNFEEEKIKAKRY